MEKNNYKLIALTVSEEMLSLRLDKALSLISEIKTRSRAENLLEKNLVRVNGSLQKSSYKIKANDIIEVQIPESSSSELQPLDLKLEILFEDKDLIVINKPHGLVVHPAAGHEQDTLVNALIAHTSDLSMKFGEKRPGIVHRLDRDTSGVLVIAKNDFAHETLVQQFKNKKPHRIYYALVHGKPKLTQGTIQSFLNRHPIERKKYSSLLGADKKIIRDINANPEQGKWAVTHYQVLQSTDQVSFIQLKLETGRTHQIRVHMLELGHPIVGDPIYGHKKSSYKDFPRLALHAAELGFQHPKTSEYLLFKSPWPLDEYNLKFFKKKFNP